MIVVFKFKGIHFYALQEEDDENYEEEGEAVDTFDSDFDEDVSYRIYVLACISKTFAILTTFFGLHSSL